LILEHHDVAAADVTDGQQRAARAGRAEDELVDEEVIADEEVVLHRPRRDLEGLDDPRPHEEREDDRNDDRLEVLAERGFFELSHTQAALKGCAISSRCTLVPRASAPSVSEAW